MTDKILNMMLRAAVAEQACSCCANTGSITNGRGELDECTTCRGELCNPRLISLLQELVLRDQFKQPVDLAQESIDRIVAAVAQRIQNAEG